MNSTTIKFSVTSGDEEAFLKLLKEEHVPFTTCCDGDPEYKYYTVVPVCYEISVQNEIHRQAKKADVRINVQGMYQDPGTGKTDMWNWTT